MLSLAYGAAPGGTPTEGGAAGGGLMALMPIILIFAVLFFLLILPQRREQKKRGKMLTSLNRGDKIVTSGGLHGVITKVEKDIITLRVNDKTVLTVDKTAITRVKS